MPLAIIASRRHLLPPTGVRVLRRDLSPWHTANRWGLLVTTRAYSSFEHLVELPFADAVPFAHRALAQGWFTGRDVERRLSAPYAGNRALRRVLAALERGIESELERRAARLLRSAGITGWRPNKTLHQGGRFVARCDIVFDRLRLVIELQGYRYHAPEGPFQKDMHRHNDFEFTDWTVLRFGWKDVVENPDYVIRTVKAMIERRSAAA